jgi:hypothetical protein
MQRNNGRGFKDVREVKQQKTTKTMINEKDRTITVKAEDLNNLYKSYSEFRTRIYDKFDEIGIDNPFDFLDKTLGYDFEMHFFKMIGLEEMFQTDMNSTLMMDSTKILDEVTDLEHLISSEFAFRDYTVKRDGTVIVKAEDLMPVLVHHHEVEDKLHDSLNSVGLFGCCGFVDSILTNDFSDYLFFIVYDVLNIDQRNTEDIPTLDPEGDSKYLMNYVKKYSK